MEDKLKIGNRIKTLREELDYTQKQLAKKLGLKGETAIANYEAGYSIPKDNIKLKMCELFNCSLDYLMCKSDIRNPEKQIVANNKILDVSDLDEKDIQELQEQIEYKRWKKQNLVEEDAELKHA